MTVEIDVTEFVAGIDDEVDILKRVTERVIIGVATRMIEVVVPQTPIDTGKARRNWQVTFLAPATQVLAGVDPSPGGTFTVNEQLARIRQYRFGPVVWIVNNVPYMLFLNEGSSRQAPAGFVEAAIAQAQGEGASAGLGAV